jgi:hypothetical protein
MVKITSDPRKGTEIKEKSMSKNVRDTIDKTEIKEELIFNFLIFSSGTSKIQHPTENILYLTIVYYAKMNIVYHM